MRKKIVFAFIPILILFLILCGLELLLRFTPRTTEEIEFAFFTEFKISRWKYLNKLENRLLIDNVLSTEPYTKHIEPPESNRPPFDRVPYPYEVQYNNLGFRDIYFDSDTKPKKRVIVLGDSVSFGKGVSVSERYSDLLRERYPNWEIWNLGLQGCTAECMLQIVETHFAEMQPDILIVQASGNDIDQTLWKVATSQQMTALSIQALEWVQYFRILEYWVYRNGKENLKRQLTSAHIPTKERYGQDIHRIIKWAQSNRIPLISINLPFAYGYHYGQHQQDICKEYPKTCVPLEIQFPKVDTEQTNPKREYVDFIEATAKELGFSEQELQKIFLSRIFFHDVCHLSPKGHRTVAEQLYLLLDRHQ